MTRCSRLRAIAVVAAFAAGCAGAEQPAASAPATGAPPPPAAPATPLVIAGQVTRPDGSPLPAVQISVWRRDEKGELAEIGAHVATLNNGAFELPAPAGQPEVAALRFRWQRHRVHQVLDTGLAQPAGEPVDAWLEAPAIADWSAIAVVLDTGWTASGLVQSLDRDFDVRRVQVMADVIGQSQRIEETGVFVVKDLPWAVERCTIRVYDQGQLVASGEASRPDRERGARETWVEILVPER